MTTTVPEARTDAGPGQSETTDGDAARGWYLYGITRRGALGGVLAEADAAAPGDAAPLELIEVSGLMAVVRPVPLADFGRGALQARLRDASALEAMVRGHNHVIETVHAHQAILPAKLGMVYASARDIVAALRATCDTLLPQLHRLEACDEWALHLYADRAVVRERTAARIPALARLRAECAAARPGRAWFLERQHRDEVDAAARQALVTLAQDAFDRLSRAAVAAQVDRVEHAAKADGEVEILRAAFLVARDHLERFDAALRAVADAGAGLRCETNGPWPPYSFAVGEAREAR